MKKIISVFCALLLLSAGAFAQKKDNEAWREKVRAEQVALITSELGLTEAEAQAFWPVYNEVQQQRRQAFKASSCAMKALKEGVQKEEDVARLLNEYEKAKQECNAVEEESMARYKKVLPAEKVAKLVLAEEKFRHQQINKLGKNNKHPGPDGPRGEMPPKDRPMEGMN